MQKMWRNSKGGRSKIMEEEDLKLLIELLIEYIDKEI